jgi:divalent metal cation (Fe/Co/Zn/Cd) transporter
VSRTQRLWIVLCLNLAIAAAAIQHLAAGVHRVEGLPVLVASGIADTAADAAAAAGVAVSGAIILAAGGWYWLDPAVALTIAVIISYHALRLLRKITAALIAVLLTHGFGGTGDRRPAPQVRDRHRA